MNKIQIAIVDDHNLFRKGLIRLINMGDSLQRYNILFEADNGNQMKEKMKLSPFPDIILMDIDMPELDGFESVEWLQRTHGDVKVLVMTMLEKESAILRMLRMGVKGYIHKDIEVADLHAALESIAANGIYYSEAATEVMQQNLNGLNNTTVQLSEKEREFIKFAITDMTYQQIADQMNLSVKTIDGYRETLFRKLHVKTRVTLAMHAVKHGLVEL
ncbi:response regulator [Chitinophaga ginsengisoli]|uniref:LuxR family two component transcriptional regulator n=1 Tax=Chitinophaga ginsengisoli TaxID=363837 RepID=A0A2P8G2J7_9BACT|nr:response regulator transcription factor [Chitinophaga ginsengisoli]PSL28191.1 LuxR family two component transcriptional regulator [Chitinophaga ginsengisoli]